MAVWKYPFTDKIMWYVTKFQTSIFKIDLTVVSQTPVILFLFVSSFSTCQLFVLILNYLWKIKASSFPIALILRLINLTNQWTLTIFFCFFLHRMTKSPKVGTVLGPFDPKTQNTTHQSSIPPLLHSFYHILSSYKKLLKTVKPFSRYSTLKNRAIWLDEPFLAIFGQIRIFPKNMIRPLFTPYTPLTSCKKSEKSN